MALFPQINSAIARITGLPYTETDRWWTLLSETPGGQRYSFAMQDAPLKEFQVAFPQISAAEITTLRTFWDSVHGPLNTFGFLNPAGNLLATSDDYSSGWTLTNVTITSSTQTDPFGGALATLFSISGSVSISSPFLTGVDVTGYVMCGSVWVTASSSGTLTLRLKTASGSPQDATFNLTAGAPFKRFYNNGWVVPDSSTPTFSVLWSGTGNITLFSSQVSPTIAAGPRIQSPGNYGYFPRCRFATQDFPVHYERPVPTTSLSLPIVSLP